MYHIFKMWHTFVTTASCFKKQLIDYRMRLVAKFSLILLKLSLIVFGRQRKSKFLSINMLKLAKNSTILTL